ncbi:YeeE/YedE thiosulfate transporter family protein [Thiomicrorhabdus sp. ZW0627]|uniref:YeeE/YedE thiosulfate transporter family protein n=1 Tax=Thiomicrorhabdus sp. ZW0627 TaxID=3039774 RepID=UPI002436DE27|nr:YeeE/YedE thiosulfate transporter family protein [Thiomicrorhabdus sp. ZW0627]MDG6774510.1 YeeE/YedE thiosulfate transporter family protein [Thiomicrorhabdus sp. ZW0627]
MYKFPLLKSAKLFLISFSFVYRANFLALVMGVMFGFLMSHAGATTYDYHAKMFLMIDFQLMEVIATAVIVSMIGVFLLKQFHIRAISTGAEVDFVKKPYQSGLVTGAFLFGIGWAMTASCPGTVPAMIGEGKVGAVFVLAGLLLGTMAFGVLQTFIAHNKTISDTFK